MSERISADEARRLRDECEAMVSIRQEERSVQHGDAFYRAVLAAAASVERLEADNQRLRAALDGLEVQAAEMEAECLKPPCQHAWGIRVAIERIRRAVLSDEGDTSE